MITDSQANKAFFSRIFVSRFPELWKEIQLVLKQRGIPYDFIDNTRNIWCRDYMPIQVDDNHFVEFQYFPDYYLTPEHFKNITIQVEMQFKLDIAPKKVKLILDGGNIVRSVNKAIITDKVFTDNKTRFDRVVLNTLEKELMAEIHIIPRQPYDWTGHADGMVRFYDEKNLLVNDFRSESLSWRKQMDSALKKTGLNIIEFPYVQTDKRTDDGEYTAHGCYINFAQIGNTILFPQFAGTFSKSDKMALWRIKELYNEPLFHAFPINADKIAWEGGVLNCVTWNIKI